MIRTVINIAIIWLLLFGSSQPMASNGDTAFLRSSRKIDVCDDAKKSVIITLDIGSISKSDSLYGYNFRVDFDNEKIDFHTLLYLNTLSELFEYKNANFFNSEGYLEGYAVNLTGPPVSGDRPLLGLFGDYIDDCPDTTIVSIGYIDFTDEFEKKYTVYESASVYAFVYDKDDRFLSVEFDTDTIQDFNDEFMSEALLSLETNPGLMLESAKFQIKIHNNELFEISNVSSVSDNVFIEDMNIENGTAIIETSILNDISQELALSVDILQKKRSKEIADITCEILNINNCACITRLNSGSAVIKGIPEDTSIYVGEVNKSNDIKCYFDQYNESIMIESEINTIMNIDIYNISGQIVKQLNDVRNRAVHIDVSDLTTDCYILSAEMNNRKQYTKILIKY